MLGAQNSSQRSDFCTRGRHENLNVSYIAQSYFSVPRQTIRNNGDRIIMFKQTLRDFQSIFYDIGACDMLYSEFKERCHKAWSEKLNYICNDMTKNKIEGEFRTFNENKNT